MKYSLKEKPEDRHINTGIIIDKIKADTNFKEKIEEIIKKYGTKNYFDTLKNESLNYKDKDLFLTLNNTDINVKGKRQTDKWILNITITDIYDFTDFKELEDYYNGSIVSFFWKFGK